MALLKDGKICSNDWHRLADDTPDNGKQSVLVPFKRLQAEAQGFKQRAAPLGVILQPGQKMDDGDDVRALAPWLDTLQLIAIEFPAFRNGRGYSMARILREEMGWTKELRACGEVLRDQWQFMHRCGINALDLGESNIAPDILEQQFADAIGELSLAYQPDSLSATSVLHKRHKKN